MPRSWSPKDERQYGHILKSCRRAARYGLQRCKQISAATVNKRRRVEGRTLSGIDPSGMMFLMRPLVLGGLALYLLYQSDQPTRSAP